METRSLATRIEQGLTLVVGLAAIIAAMAALYQASLARRQARAAAWPYLGQGNSLSAGRPYVRTIANQGVGPARIRSAHIEVDGHAIGSWSEAARKLIGHPLTDYEYSWIGPGRVLSPGAADTLLTIPSRAGAVAFWQVAPARMRVVVCYCSIYDECWETSDGRADPRPVAACEVSGATSAIGP